MYQDLDLRYGEERLPRYTSYPTAPHFSGEVSQQSYRIWLSTIPQDRTVSLYLHIPYCRSMCWYCGCNTTVSRGNQPIAEYLSALRREIDLVKRLVARPLRVSHIHFGGGTPTIMTPAQFSELMNWLRQNFTLTPDAEIAVEIDPRALTREMASEMGASGVTRASLGIQSLDSAVQQAINRIQSFEDTATASERLRAAGVRGINFDLMYGLPHQTVSSCSDTASQCLRLAPDRVAVFGYAHVPTLKKHQTRIDNGALADANGRRLQARTVARSLSEAGYRQIGLDHFALPGDSLTLAQERGTLRRNFQGYTADASDILIGFGASAIGRLDQGYIQNEVGTRSYCAQIGRGDLATRKGHALTANDRLRADIVERLMCDFRVDLRRICMKHGTTTNAVLQPTLRLMTLAADGVVRLDGSVLSVVDEARHLVRSVASAFDAYIATPGPIYSRAV